MIPTLYKQLYMQNNSPLTLVSMEHASVKMRESKIVARVSVNQPYGIRAAKFLSKNLQNNKHFILGPLRLAIQVDARVLGSFKRLDLRHNILRENMDLFVHAIDLGLSSFLNH